jgi:hypothetical protein
MKLICFGPIRTQKPRANRSAEILIFQCSAPVVRFSPFVSFWF